MKKRNKGKVKDKQVIDGLFKRSPCIVATVSDCRHCFRGNENVVCWKIETVSEVMKSLSGQSHSVNCITAAISFDPLVHFFLQGAIK